MPLKPFSLYLDYSLSSLHIGAPPAHQFISSTLHDSKNLYLQHGWSWCSGRARTPASRTIEGLFRIQIVCVGGRGASRGGHVPLLCALIHLVLQQCQLVKWSGVQPAPLFNKLFSILSIFTGVGIVPTLCSLTKKNIFSWAGCCCRL